MITEEGHIILDANGSKVLDTMKKIRSEGRSLQAQLDKLTINSDEWKKTASAVQELNKQKTKLNDTLRGTNKLWESIKSQMISVGAVALGFLGFQMITSQIGNMIRKNAELSDSLANIRVKAKMTQEEVERLNESFGKLGSRTSGKDLRSMAFELATLGIDKDKLLEATAAVDNMSIAMEGEFNSASEATQATGKLRNILDDIRTKDPAKDFLNIGNALIELGNAGLATAPVVSDFATRIGAVGISLGLTSGQVLGISASMQELGLTAERGGTATAKILQKMSNNVEGFAAIARVSVSEFAQMVNTDLYGAFKLVLEESQKNAQSATALASLLKDAELSGAGASEVFLKLGRNVGMMDEKVKLASGSLQSTSAIMDSFAIKNETFGAKLDKLGKAIYGFLANSAVIGFFESMTDSLLKLAEQTNEAEKAIDKFNKANDQYKKTADKLNPLLERYDELKKKTKLGKDEQIELNKIIKEVSEIAPGAVTAFNNIGGAIDISSKAGRDFLENMQRIKQVMNEEAVKVVEAKYDKNQEKSDALYKQIQKEREFLERLKADPENVLRASGFSASDVEAYIPKQNQIIMDLNKEWQKTVDLAESYRVTIDHLNGKDLLKPKPKEETKKTVTYVPTPEEIEKAKKAIEDYIKETARLTKELRTANAQGIDDELQREVELAKVRYENNLDDLKQYEQSIIDKRKAGKPLTEEEKKREVILTELKLQLLEEYQRKAGDLIKKFNEKQAEEEFKQTIANLENTQAARRNLLKKKFAEGVIDEKTYQEQLFQLQQQDLTERKTAYEDYGKDVTDIDEKITDGIINNAKKISKANETAAEKSVKAWKKFLDETEKQFNQWSSVTIDIVSSFNDIAQSKDEESYNLKKKQTDDEIQRTRAQSDERMALIEEEYKKGYLTKEKYDNAKAVSEQQLADKISMLNAQLDEQQKKDRYEQAKRDKNQAAFSAAIYGSVAIIKAFAENLLLGFATAAAVAIQIAAIEARPLPEYAVGGETKVKGESGKNYSAKNVGSIAGGGHYNTPSYGIVAEKGSEYVIPNWIYTMPEMANVIGMLEAVRVRGYAGGGSTQASAPVGNNGGGNNDALLIQMMMVMEKLCNKLDEPIKAQLNYDELSYDLKRIGEALDTGNIRSS